MSPFQGLPTAERIMAGSFALGVEAPSPIRYKWPWPHSRYALRLKTLLWRFRAWIRGFLPVRLLKRGNFVHA